jgi:hypothetical protein
MPRSTLSPRASHCSAAANFPTGSWTPGAAGSHWRCGATLAVLRTTSISPSPPPLLSLSVIAESPLRTPAPPPASRCANNEHICAAHSQMFASTIATADCTGREEALRPGRGRADGYIHCHRRRAVCALVGSGYTCRARTCIRCRPAPSVAEGRRLRLRWRRLRLLRHRRLRLHLHPRAHRPTPAATAAAGVAGAPPPGSAGSVGHKSQTRCNPCDAGCGRRPQPLRWLERRGPGVARLSPGSLQRARLPRRAGHPCEQPHPLGRARRQGP